MPDVSASNSYDEVLYHSAPLEPTHPNHLATIATLMGMQPPPVEHCRVLELGCATGGNLIPMAYALPQSEFVGIDLSARQIAEGQALVAKLELRNITLKQLNILDVPPDFGQFDYIIAYGTYSWVPAPVQDALLRIAKHHLAPNGVAFVSYNTYPGWHLRGMVRDMLLYHSQHFSGIHEQTAQAWSMLNFLVEGTTALRPHMPGLELYNQLLVDEQKVLETRPKFYFVHEHMEEHNEPVYFHQFVARAAQHGLQYLAEANFVSSLTATLPPHIAATVEKIAPDRIAAEQYIDFLTSRMFRQTLLCHADQVLQTDLKAVPLSALQFASPASSVGPDDAAYEPEITKIRTAEGNVLALHEPLAQTALQLLIDDWPQAFLFNDLLGRAYAQVQGVALGTRPAAEINTAAQQLGATLMRCFMTGAVDLRVYSPVLELTAGERPVASAIARLEVQEGRTVTNLLHERVTLDAVSEALLPLLDGTRDRTMLRNSMAQHVAEGKFVLEGRAVTGEGFDQQALLAELVEEGLRLLGRSALLLS